jgi:NaMN:DMB phosphoribosyltransferase
MDKSSYAIPVLDNPALAAQIAARWNNLTKPPGSLGRLEEIATRPGATAATRDLPSPGLTKPACRYKVRPEARRA